MTKYELRQYRYLKQELKQLEEEMRELRCILESPSGKKLTGMPGMRSVKGDKTGSMLVRLEELEKKYADKCDRLLEEKWGIENAISSLEGRERVMMRYKYIDCITWEEIAEKMGFRDVRRVYQLHGVALGKLKNI